MLSSYFILRLMASSSSDLFSITNFLYYIFWCSHLYRNWYRGLSSRCLCLICPAFAMPMGYCCLDWMSYLCDLRQTHLLSYNLMIACLITRTRNNHILSSLCGFPFGYTFPGLCQFHNSHSHIFRFHNDCSFVAVITDFCQISIKNCTLSIKWWFTLASFLSLWFRFTLPHPCNRI